MRRPVNPYGDLRALVDATRALDPAEQAELHLEQGFVERALAIYASLAEAHPEVPFYRHRRDWLRRLAAPTRPVTGSAPSVESTLRGFPAPTRSEAAPPPRPSSTPAQVRRVVIVGVG